MPKEYIEILAPCQDQAKPSDFGQVTALLEKEIGQPLEVVFQSIDPIPLGSASLAQVSRYSSLSTPQ